MSHGGVSDQLAPGSMAYFVFSFIRALSYLGVNCFVLLSGYFLCESSFKPSRIIKTMMQVLFYSVFCVLLSFFVWHKKLGIKNLFFAVFLSLVASTGLRQYTLSCCFNDLIRSKPWEIINAPRYLDNLIIEVTYLIGVVTAIFIAGCIIELFRKKIIGILRIEEFFGGMADRTLDKAVYKIEMKSNQENS